MLGVVAGVSKLFIPPCALWLAKLKCNQIHQCALLIEYLACRHGGSSHDTLIAFHKSVSVVMTGATLVTVLVAPMVAVFALDENCEFTLQDEN